MVDLSEIIFNHGKLVKKELSVAHFMLGASLNTEGVV